MCVCVLILRAEEYAVLFPRLIIMNLQLLGEPGAGGSSTPSMVGAVKKWQKSDPQNSLETWKKLSDANSALEMHLNTLSKLADTYYDDYRSVISRCSLLTSEKVYIMPILFISCDGGKIIWLNCC